MPVGKWYMKNKFLPQNLTYFRKLWSEEFVCFELMWISLGVYSNQEILIRYGFLCVKCWALETER
jgi:hypothetical protein